MIKKRQKKSTGKHVQSYLQTSQLRKKRRRQRLLLKGFWLIVLLGLVFGGISLLKLNAFQVDAVEVEGAVQLPSADVQKKVMDSILASRHLFGLVPNSSTFFVNEKNLEQMLAADFPVISHVNVDTGLGGTVDVEVAERQAAAIWCNADMSECFQMDADGFVFLPYVLGSTANASGSSKIIFRGVLNEGVTDAGTADAAHDMPVNASTNASTSELALSMKAAGNIIGQTFLSAKEIKAFADARDILKKSRKDIDYVRCDSASFCQIKIANNGVLRIDPAGDLVTAFDRLDSALTSPVFAKGTFEYIDLRFGNKLFYKLSNGVTDADAKAASSTSSADDE